jgi:hypothetical protein
MSIFVKGLLMRQAKSCMMGKYVEASLHKEVGPHELKTKKKNTRHFGIGIGTGAGTGIGIGIGIGDRG